MIEPNIWFYEQPLYFPPELEHIHVEADIDEEISYLLNNRDETRKLNDQECCEELY